MQTVEEPPEVVKQEPGEPEQYGGYGAELTDLLAEGFPEDGAQTHFMEQALEHGTQVVEALVWCHCLIFSLFVPHFYVSKVLKDILCLFHVPSTSSSDQN